MSTKAINWKVFAILYVGCLIGIIGVIPYSLTLQAEILNEVPLPLSVLIAISIVQSAFLFFVVTLVGLFVSKKIGFGAPLLERLTEKREIFTQLGSISGISIGLGILAGFLLIFGDYLFSLFDSTDLSGIMNIPPPWQGFLVSFYGGINEEILLRLCFMSILIWGITRLQRKDFTSPQPFVIWVSILLASVVFGLAHLPIVATLTKVTPLYVIRSVTLNGIGGIIFGWLYWKKGIESSILSHFTADIILHVLYPFLFFS